jgi:hypothetical protein
VGLRKSENYEIHSVGRVEEKEREYGRVWREGQ